MKKYTLLSGDMPQHLQYSKGTKKIHKKINVYSPNKNLVLNDANLRVVERITSNSAEILAAYKILRTVCPLQTYALGFNSKNIRPHEQEAFLLLYGAESFQMNTSNSTYDKDSLSYIDTDFSLDVQEITLEKDTLTLSAAKEQQAIVKGLSKVSKFPTLNPIFRTDVASTFDIDVTFLQQSTATMAFDLEKCRIMATHFVAELNRVVAYLRTLDFGPLEMQEYEGFFKDIQDNSKSYMYLVQNSKGDVGFLGLKMKNNDNTYRQNYSLTVVKDLSAAFIFKQEDYKKCGIQELQNTHCYPHVEVIECVQQFRMEDKDFRNPKMQEFASTLQKIQIDKFLEQPLPSTKKTNKL